MGLSIHKIPSLNNFTQIKVPSKTELLMDMPRMITQGHAEVIGSRPVVVVAAPISSKGAPPIHEIYSFEDGKLSRLIGLREGNVTLLEGENGGLVEKKLTKNKLDIVKTDKNGSVTSLSEERGGKIYSLTSGKDGNVKETADTAYARFLRRTPEEIAATERACDIASKYNKMVASQRRYFSPLGHDCSLLPQSPVKLEFL